MVQGLAVWTSSPAALAAATSAALFDPVGSAAMILMLGLSALAATAMPAGEMCGGHQGISRLGALEGRAWMPPIWLRSCPSPEIMPLT